VSRHRQTDKVWRAMESDGMAAVSGGDVHCDWPMPVEGAVGPAQLRTPSLSRCWGWEATNRISVEPVREQASGAREKRTSPRASAAARHPECTSFGALTCT
jgi:hypothetical protein